MADGVKGAFSLNLSQNICKPELEDWIIGGNGKSAPMTLISGVFGVAYIFIYEFEVFGLSYKEAK